MEASKYKVVNGTSYHVETCKEVIDWLETAKERRQRIIVDYGDTTTGQSWGETFDISGYVGRSTGINKIPLLVYNSRSTGGGAILDHCIIKISWAKGKKVLCQHPTYKEYKHEPIQQTV